MITYDYYRIFYFVARYKSFTKAAKMLGNNQPNITRCMNILEQELKCTLFLRSNRGISLTPEGKKLYEHVAIAYEQLQIGEEEIRQNGELENGLVSIGASENALRLVLLSRLEKFYKEFRNMWLKERKPFGFEIQDIRLGGIIQRIKYCRYRLNEFLNNKITNIEELEQIILEPLGMQGEGISYNYYGVLGTTYNI